MALEVAAFEAPAFEAPALDPDDVADEAVLAAAVPGDVFDDSRDDVVPDEAVADDVDDEVRSVEAEPVRVEPPCERSRGEEPPVPALADRFDRSVRVDDERERPDDDEPGGVEPDEDDEPDGVDPDDEPFDLDADGPARELRASLPGAEASSTWEKTASEGRESKFRST